MRRFIAGAICPQCRAVDRLVLEMVTQDPAGAGTEGAEKGAGEKDAGAKDAGEKQRRTCVACGFSDQMGSSVGATLPKGRVEGGHLQKPPVDATVVKILQPEKPDKR